MMKPTLRNILVAFTVLVLPAVILAQTVVAPAPSTPAPTTIQALFLQIVVPAIFTAIAGIVTWGGARLIALIDAKTKNEAVAGVLSRLASAVMTVVLDVNGTVKAKYIALAADGNISDADKKELAKVGLDKVKEHLGAKGLQELAAVLGLKGDLIDSFLSSHIEAAVESLKDRTPTVDPAVSSVDPS